MKTTRFVVIGLFFCFLQSCTGTDRLDKVIRTYRVENGTERKIKMEFYGFGIFHQTRQIIGEGQIFERTVDSDAGSILAASGALNADSVIVMFDDSRIKTYTNISLETRVNIEPIARNFLLDDSYEIIDNELYIFTFTEEDYENATEISQN